jgi:hypothetical protein
MRWRCPVVPVTDCSEFDVFGLMTAQIEAFPTRPGPTRVGVERLGLVKGLETPIDRLECPGKLPFVIIRARRLGPMAYVRLTVDARLRQASLQMVGRSSEPTLQIRQLSIGSELTNERSPR